MLLKTPKRTEPTRYSELSTFSQCKRRWYFSYYLNLGKIRNSMTIQRGSLGDVALAALDTGENPQEAVTKYVEEAIAALPEIETDEELEVGINDAYADTLRETATKVIEQVHSYIEYYPRWFKVHRMKEKFTIKVPGSPIPVQGEWDGIVEDEYGIWVLERKWVKGFRTEEMHDLDGQIAIYHLAAKAYGFHITGVIIDQVNVQPSKPTLNKNGQMSRVKKGDWRTYEKALLEAGLNPAHYEDMKDALPECKEFRRDRVYRSLTEVKNYNKDLVSRIRDLTSTKKRIYMVDDRIRCSTCSFRELCIEEVKGGDVDYLLKNEFTQKTNPYATDKYADEETYSNEKDAE